MNKLQRLKSTQAQRMRLTELITSDAEMQQYFLGGNQLNLVEGIEWLAHVFKTRKVVENQIEAFSTQSFLQVDLVVKNFFSYFDTEDEMIVTFGYSSQFHDPETGVFVRIPNVPPIIGTVVIINLLYEKLSKKGLDFFACSSLDRNHICFIDSSVGDRERCNPDVPVYEYFSYFNSSYHFRS